MNDALPADLVTRNRQVAEAALRPWALWVGIGAAASGYVFLVSTKTILDPTSPFVGIFDWPGGNWNSVAFAAAALAGVTWLVLTIPVLIAGLRRILGWPGKRLMAAAWAGAWVAGVALMALIPASVASSRSLSPTSAARPSMPGHLAASSR